MKTYLFYSPANREVVGICAPNVEYAIELLNKINAIGCKIIKDDYILATTVKCDVGAIGIVNTQAQNDD